MTDSKNNFTLWNNGSNRGGPYNGTQRSGASSSTNRWEYAKYDSKIIWDWYTGEDWTIDYVDENGASQIWNAKDDSRRTLKYYYPTSSFSEREYEIAPKFTVVSYHAHSASAGSSSNIAKARQRCAAYQQYGYPAGRWRLPTVGEMQLVKKLQRAGKIKDIFGGSVNWSATSKVNESGSKTSLGIAYVRCVYDNWYWERYDQNGNTLNRIPTSPLETILTGRTSLTSDPTTSTTVQHNWKIFVWGDRPKENPEATTRGGRGGYTVQDYLEENAPGNYVVIRNGDNVKLEKMK